MFCYSVTRYTTYIYSGFPVLISQFSQLHMHGKLYHELDQL